MREENAFQQEMQQIEKLIQSIQLLTDPATRASVNELIEALMSLHGAGIERMLEIADDAGAPGAALIDSFADDQLVGSLLLLYGLHPLDIETRVVQALNKVRPYLQSHGGNVELLGIAEGVVQLRLQGSCHGCPSSAMTLKLAIEEAIYTAAPDVTALEVEGVVERPLRASPNVIPLEIMGSPSRSTHSNGSGWEEVKGLMSLPQGAVRTLDVSGQPILFCRIDETWYAYASSCPACGRKLRTSRLEATALVCPSCERRYDVLRAGRGIDTPDLQLEPFPLLIEHGQAMVALPNSAFRL
ncbi:MAG: NifU family protein [Roseiflexaceae bacterium]